MRRNQKGYSLVEAIIALGIAGIVAVSVMSAFPYLRKLNNRARGGGACRAYIDAAFGKLEQEGFRGNYDMTIPTTTTNVPNSLAWGSVPMQPWGAAGLPLIGFTNSDEFTQLRTPGLITSSVTLVNALYRSQSTICSTTYQIVGSASALPAFLPQPPVEMHDPGNVSLHGFRVRMSVKPFDLNRSSVVGCTDTGFDATAAAIPVPKGLAITGAVGDSELSRTQAERSGTIGTAPYPIARQVHSGSTTTITTAATDALGRNNLGFLVNLEVEFKSKDPNDLSGDGDKTQICEESRLIAYAADLTVPSAPTVPAPVVVRPAFNLIDFEPQSVTLTFQHGPSGEAATVLMCRDNSTWMVGPIGGEPTKVYPAGLPSVPASARWVPCEKTTACGIIATGAPVFGGVDGSNYNIQKTWTNSLPYGCRIQLEVVAVDAAGNVSTPTNLGFNIVDPP